MILNNNLKTIVTLSIFGFVFMGLLNSLEGILISVLKIIGMIAHFPPKLFYSLDFIPAIILLILWIVLIFVSLKGFARTEILPENLPRRLVLRFFILAIILFLLSYMADIIYVLLQPKYLIDYPNDKFIMIVSPVVQTLRFLRIIIIFFWIL